MECFSGFLTFIFRRSENGSGTQASTARAFAPQSAGTIQKREFRATLAV